ncbi:FAD-binding domain-containing protein [Paraphaeosphaeria sporulosa]|uniref:FAD-binding domain-containing protein n=1 Tax=Paraphaeosphaeria sporulosa TaxID=1460663 RepID=A0A177C0E0_9PLEO|nr:FAD-binding domain-containing protein [Paraphaeosphaeria sporulosa]OAG00945.1 FAD-binding domain-containing protein [Paraphaeosphaeria sporulosa]
MALFCVFMFLASTVVAVNFDFENKQLADSDTIQFPALRFGDVSQPLPQEECRYSPDDDDWPSDAEWQRFNATLGGVLLKPQPLAISCYAGPEYDAAKCAILQSGWRNMAQHANHPISVMSQWATGMTCVPTKSPDSTCVQGGFPVFTVNATTVQHVQMAVNFARNRNIRLVIKNSGHNFNGNNIGGNSLSIWVHNLRGLTYHPNFTIPGYTGRAVAMAGGTRATDVSAASRMYNTTILNAGGADVAVPGGYFQGAGHSSYASFYGLAADHVLQIRAVTADGRFVVADAQTNPDLFWAFRGGGGGTFGVVTSIVVRTFPLTPIASTSISFSTISRPGLPGVSNESFWAGIQEYMNFSTPLCDNGGFGYNFIRHGSNSGATGLTFTSSLALPNRTLAELRSFTKPFLQRLNEVGIPVSIPKMQTIDIPNLQDQPKLKKRALGDVVGHTLIASRLFQRYNYADDASISEMQAAIRSAVEEGGYDIHGQVMSPTISIAGNPNNAVLPAFRTAIMHTQIYEPNASWDGSTVVEPPELQARRHDRLQSYLQRWRDITPGGGAYMNEGDMQDPEWKDTFYGSHYEGLLEVKKKWDPEGVFWVISGVGSDEWEVRDSSGGGLESLYTQDGKLCRVEATGEIRE